MTSSILHALSILTKPAGEVSVSQAHGSQQQALLDALEANQRLLQEHLRSLEGEPEVAQALEAVRNQNQNQADWAKEQTDDVTWSFARECLVLLLGLARHLAKLRAAFDQAQQQSSLASTSDPLQHLRQRRPNLDAAPPLPPDVLSVSQQRALCAGLQFAVTLGLCPYLAPGVGVPLSRRSALGAAVEGAVRRDASPPAERRLLVTACALLELGAVPSLATELFTRHLGDVMAALCQLGHRPQRPEGGAVLTEKAQCLSAEERRKCREALQSLMGKVYQPIVIKELLVLQGGPKQSRGAPSAGPGPGPGGSAGGGGRAALPQAPAWLRRLCGQLLSERLMQPSGVQYVVRAILQGGSGGDADWRKCDAVARILATCPQQSLSPEAYYSQVCPQVIELLHFKDKLTAQQFQRVATRAALTIVEEHSEFAHRFLLEALLKPLLCCATAAGEGEDGGGSVEEWELSRCVDDVYKICVVGNSPSEPLLRGLAKVFPVIFDLYCFTKKNVSHLRAPCQEILLWHLSQAEPGQALSLLRQACGLEEAPGGGGGGGGGGGVAPGWQFSPGSEGGVILTPKESISDEDEELYERVCGEQWRVECVAQLLGEMKDSDLPATLFLQLLQELTSMAAEQEEEVMGQEVDTSSMTLLELEQHLIGRVAGPSQKVALLQVLAVLCEGLPHTALLRKPAQAMEFIEAMLQRACVGMEQRGPEQGEENPVETQSLRMGMGLVAALMSGDTKLSGEDYAAMSRLMPPLERVSELHPDALVRELATDLRAAIATHGAYRPDTITRAAATNTTPRPANAPQRPPSHSHSHAHTHTHTPSHAPTHSHTHAGTVPAGKPTPAAVPRKAANTTTTTSKLSTHCKPKPLITEISDEPTVSPEDIRAPSPHGTPAPSSSVMPPPEKVRSPGDGNHAVAASARGGEGGGVGIAGDRSGGRGIGGGGVGIAGDRSGGRGIGRGGGGVGSAGDRRGSDVVISECLLEACDPEVPTRAVALRTLTRALQDRQPGALERQETLLTLFLENLEHEDSFIYLSAIQGLAVLADAFPERILQRLLGEYQAGPTHSHSHSQQQPTASTQPTATHTTQTQQQSTAQAQPPTRTVETRLKMGEVLMRSSRAMGDLAPHYGYPLVGAFLSGTRDPDPTMRASCLANLGELCQLLRFSLGPWAQELSVCLTCLIKSEREAEVRRAAVHVITLLLRGLSDTATQVLSDVLLELYRALKWAAGSDRDEVVVLHAQLALEELDQVMRRLLFPQQKLEKKIVVRGL